jgi:CheY-like chemotaxis protein
MPTILVVDDSLSVRKVAERMLKEAGLEVALAANGEEAIAWLSTNTPNLVIADVIMPDKSGFEVCAFVRAQASLSNTPVLLISGFVDDEVTRQAEACRADGVIKKPFQGASLRERVLDLLSARKEQEVPAAASAPELVLEMPALAPKPEITIPVAPPVPAPAPAPELVLEMPALAPESEITIPVAPPVPAPAPAPELVFEMPALAPEPEITLPSAPPIPAPAPVVRAAPAAPVAMPALQLAGEVRALHETIQRLEARVADQGINLVRLEQQLQASRESATEAIKKISEMEQTVQAFRDNADRAVTQVHGLEARLAEEEKQSAELRTRLADLEPAAASAKQLLQMLAEFARQTIKP